jgi:hypothetical protein
LAENKERVAIDVHCAVVLCTLRTHFHAITNALITHYREKLAENKERVAIVAEHSARMHLSRSKHTNAYQPLHITYREELAENKERVAIVAEHLRNVEQEHAHTQALVSQKAKEIDTEQHLQRLAEREDGRLTSDSAKITKQMQKYVVQLLLTSFRFFFFLFFCCLSRYV